MNITSRTFAFLSLAVMGSAAQAQFAVTSRLSETQAHYLIGYAGDIGQNNYTNNENDLLLSDSTALVGSQTVSGFYPPTNNNWTGTASWNVTQSYSISGSLASATKLESSGSINLGISSVGCTAEVDSLNPGNAFTVDIALASAQALTFKGTLASELPANLVTSQMYGYFWTGSNWQTFLVKFPNSTWDESLNLNAGLYRFVTFSTAKASGNESKTASWNYSIEAVPEPATMLLLAPAVAMLRRRKSR